MYYHESLEKYLIPIKKTIMKIFKIDPIPLQGLYIYINVTNTMVVWYFKIEFGVFYLVYVQIWNHFISNGPINVVQPGILFHKKSTPCTHK